jgi:hypothetical protein
MNTIETLFLPYELAVKLKELGFDEVCFGCFNHLDKSEIWTKRTYMNGLTENITAPLYQQAFRWFREKYGLFHSIRYQDDNSGPGGFDYEIQNKRGKQLNQGEYLEFKAYEEAELDCLTKLIEIVEQQNQK